MIYCFSSKHQVGSLCLNEWRNLSCFSWHFIFSFTLMEIPSLHSLVQHVRGSFWKINNKLLIVTLSKYKYKIDLFHKLSSVIYDERRWSLIKSTLLCIFWTAYDTSILMIKEEHRKGRKGKTERGYKDIVKEIPRRKRRNQAVKTWKRRLEK